MEALRKVSREWPVDSHKAEELEKALADAEAARGPLAEEFLSAQKAEAARGVRDKLARVLKKEAQLEQARGKLAALPRLDRAALEEIRSASAQLEKLQAGVDAGRLAVTVVGRTGIKIVVQEDFDPESTRTLGPGEAALLRAGGRVRIVHPEMEIEVRSGDVDSLARAEKAGEARRALEALLRRTAYPVPSRRKRAAAPMRHAPPKPGQPRGILRRSLPASHLTELKGRASPRSVRRQ